jgi:sugar-phosphatase
MPTFHCSAILFDLDGVLLDSTRAVERQWRDWAREQGIDGDKIVRVSHGVRAVEVIRAFAPHLDAEAEVRKLESGEADDHDGVAVMPGAIELLHAIPEGRWCVVTSRSRHSTYAVLQFAGIPTPKVIISADDVANGKPDPEPYLKGATALGIFPTECLVVEDALAGIRSAHAAGMKVVGLSGTHGTEKLGEADAVVSALEQLSVSVEKAGLLVTAG